jgi:hypothetical protein
VKVNCFQCHSIVEPNITTVVNKIIESRSCYPGFITNAFISIVCPKCEHVIAIARITEE